MYTFFSLKDHMVSISQCRFVEFVGFDKSVPLIIHSTAIIKQAINIKYRLRYMKLHLNLISFVTSIPEA